MKPAELFGVFVRVMALLIVIYGLWELLGGVDNVIENLIAATQGDGENLPSSVIYFVLGIPSVIFGTAVFFLADWIVRLAYRNANP